jgi:sphingolipid delta-4 desaturase
MESPRKQTGFTPKEMKEVHMIRNRKILAKYPQIRELYGPDIRLFPAVVAIVVAQFSLAVYATRVETFSYWVLLAWSIGGLLTHWLSLGNHELGHNLAFETPILNAMLGIFANFAQGIPSFVAFKKYHFLHHYYLNEQENDPDCPSKWEAATFNTPIKKAIWMMLNPAFYAIRPLILMPMPASPLEIFNIFVVLGFDMWMILYVPEGTKIVAFNMLSSILGMGIHPIAGHFNSEHYDLYGDDSGQETYSYYGPLNYVSFNVGYHNEHHDFPRISGFRLPQVRAIAPEFYEDLHPHHSWSKIVYDYIMQPDIGPFKRIIRKKRTREQ